MPGVVVGMGRLLSWMLGSAAGRLGASDVFLLWKVVAQLRVFQGNRTVACSCFPVCLPRENSSLVSDFHLHGHPLTQAGSGAVDGEGDFSLVSQVAGRAWAQCLPSICL